MVQSGHRVDVVSAATLRAQLYGVLTLLTVLLTSDVHTKYLNYSAPSDSDGALTA